jgi:hypothetical protein
MSEPISFIVNGIVADDDTFFHAIGRCGDAAIRIGDVFETMYVPVRASDKTQLGPPQSVSLKVERIQAYQRQLDELGVGMTGTIDLRGNANRAVVPGTILASAAVMAPMQQGPPTCGDSKNDLSSADASATVSDN